MSFYKAVAALSFFVREFYLPDPFESAGVLGGIMLNMVMGVALHFISYHLVGRIYASGDFPALGSLLYLLVYSAISVLFYFWSTVEFSFWVAAPYVAAAAVIYSFAELCIDGDLPWQNRKAT